MSGPLGADWRVLCNWRLCAVACGPTGRREVNHCCRSMGVATVAPPRLLSLLTVVLGPTEAWPSTTPPR